MHYALRHVTRFRYTATISESVMEARMQPRHEGLQRLAAFDLEIQPRARVLAYRDPLGNVVHHFDIPGHHQALELTADALVEVLPFPPLPDDLPRSAWDDLDGLVADGDYWEFLIPSRFVQATPLLRDLARALDVRRRDDPWSLVREVSLALHEHLAYAPLSTQVDSPIDHALRNRQGVCQDYAHVMIALLREVGIPGRYVSGYLFHAKGQDQSDEGATHAWVEVLLPELGWVGLDPTNALIAGDRHIRTAIGRDYADVPPTRGVYKGEATSELSVTVQVGRAEAPLPDPPPPLVQSWIAAQQAESDLLAQQQQQ